jgi:hypothetical protein
MMYTQEQEKILSKYPILENGDFNIPRKTIFGLIGKDDLSDDRARLIEYCNNSADRNNEMYFYDSLCAVEFILEGATAYTTPDKRICLNYPCEDICPMDDKRFRRWYFIFCHECMHQLWNTFGVADKIKKDLGSCDFQLLNIASDCVINDYLKYDQNAGKVVPTSIILPETIKTKYGVDFDRLKDTQYSLYCKLNKLNQKDKDDLKDQYGDDSQQGQGQQGQGQQGQGQQGQGQQGQGQQGNRKKAGKDDGGILTRADIEENERRMTKIIEKYSKQMGGMLGDFLNKCRSSQKLEKGGLMIDVGKGSMHWDKELANVCNKFLKQKLINIKKKYTPTYSRIKRGEQAFGDNDRNRVLKKGKKILKEKIGFNMALYIDVSGSMYNVIDKVFDTSYNIVNTLNKTFGKNEIVDPKKINLKSYVFTTKMREIKYGTKTSVGGGTYAFNDLLNDIHNYNQDAFLNIIITDGEFSSINWNDVQNIIKKMEGLVVMVTNNESNKDEFDNEMKKIIKSCGPKFKVIYTDPDFTIS